MLSVRNHFLSGWDYTLSGAMRNDIQISQGQAAVQSPGQRETTLLFITWGRTPCFHSLLVFAHKISRQQKQELCPLPPMLCKSVFWAEGRSKPLPPDIKPESPTLTAAFCSSVTELVSGGRDKTFPAGLDCSPLLMPPEALSHGNTVSLLPLQAGAGTEGWAAAYSEGRNRITLP